MNKKDTGLEVLVDYETALLAKEKGFDLPVRWYYFTKKRNRNQEFRRFEPITPDNFNNEKMFRNMVSAPTQAVLQKWLREVHKMTVSADHKKEGAIYIDGFSASFDPIHMTLFLNKFDGSDLYETTLEYGLYVALYLI